MECIYASLLLHALGRKIDEVSIREILKAAGGSIDNTRIKAVVTALDGVNIQEVLVQHIVPMTTPPVPTIVDETPAEKPMPQSSGLEQLFGM